MTEKEGVPLEFNGFSTANSYDRETSIINDCFINQVMLRQLRVNVEKTWDCSVALTADALSDFEPIYTIKRGSGGVTSILIYQECVVELAYERKAVAVTVAASSITVAEAVIAHLLKLAPEVADDNENSVTINFRTINSEGRAGGTVRELKAPAWTDASSNYPTDVRSELGHYLNPDWRPSEGGKLLLWHGPPGTGKTYAIRALARSWKAWCTFSCVTDPEQFLGRSSYMIDMLTSTHRKPWHLVILEDSGELLSVDAKDRTGQGLSRLLNASDGLIGQGLNVMTLITTNEPLKTLHPAVVRPGRCLSQAHFGEFSQGDANSWLASHGALVSVNGPRSLAQLYAVLRGDLEATETAVSEKTKPHYVGVGFQPPALREALVSARATPEASAPNALKEDSPTS